MARQGCWKEKDNSEKMAAVRFNVDDLLQIFSSQQADGQRRRGAKTTSPYTSAAVAQNLDYHHHHLSNIAPPAQGLYPFNTFRVPAEHLGDSPKPKEDDANPENEKPEKHDSPGSGLSKIKSSEEEGSSAALRKVDYLD